jgi:hypothetical protein
MRLLFVLVNLTKRHQMKELSLNFKSTDTSLQIKSVVITPAMAKELLTTNHEKNRKIKPAVVQSYKRQMEKGLWRTNTGEGIKISDSQKLINGQHRLEAIIEFGKPVEMLIFYGIPEDSMTCIDDGVKRSLTDAMMINGKSVPNQGAINGALSCLMTLYHCSKEERHYSALAGARRNSTSELIQFYDALPRFTEVAAEFFEKFKYTKVGRVVPLGIALSMYYLLKDLDEELIYSIFKSYESGIPMDDLREASPIYHAYERARRARELKIRVMPWDHIQTFLWVFAKCADKKSVNALPKFQWVWNDQNPITAHAILKLKAVKI